MRANTSRMGHPLRYGFSSWLRLLRKGFSVFLLRNHRIRPKVLPVIGPKVAAAHYAIGQVLDTNALLWRHAAGVLVATLLQPLTNGHGRNAQRVGQGTLAAENFNCASQRCVFRSFHGFAW